MIGMCACAPGVPQVDVKSNRSRQLFRRDEADRHESASTRLPARPPAVSSAQLSHCVSFCLVSIWRVRHLAGNETLGIPLALSAAECRSMNGTGVVSRAAGEGGVMSLGLVPCGQNSTDVLFLATRPLVFVTVQSLRDERPFRPLDARLRGA